MADYEEEPRDDYEGGGGEPGRSPSPQRYDERRSVSPPNRDYDRGGSDRGGYDRDYDRRDRSPIPPPRSDDLPPQEAPPSDDEDAQNEGTNLFVTGLSRSVSEAELEELFAKYGQVEKCQIMVDPHSRESRGFGFVNMVDNSSADTALSGLSGHVLAGKTLSIEKAKRKRPRTPTPGKYFGPPKPPKRGRGGFRPDFGGRGGYGRDRFYGRGPPPPRYDDRRPPYDDYYSRGGGRPSRYDDHRDYRDRYYRDRGSRYGDDRYGPPPPPHPRDYNRYGPPRSPPPPPRNDRVPPPPRDDRGGYRDYRDY